MGNLYFKLTRGLDDVVAKVSNSEPKAGDIISVSLSISPMQEGRYQINARLPDGLVVDESSLPTGAALNGNQFNWSGNITTTNFQVGFTAEVTDVLSGTVTLDFEHSVDTPGTKTESARVAFTVQQQGQGGGGSLGLLLVILMSWIKATKLTADYFLGRRFISRSTSS